MGKLKTYFFNKNSRIEFECEAPDRIAAIEYFEDALENSRVRITPESYLPDREGEGNEKH